MLHHYIIFWNLYNFPVILFILINSKDRKNYNQNFPAVGNNYSLDFFYVNVYRKYGWSVNTQVRSDCILIENISFIEFNFKNSIPRKHILTKVYWGSLNVLSYWKMAQKQSSIK